MVEGKGEDKFSGIRALERSFHIFQIERDICATQLNYWTYWSENKKRASRILQFTGL